MKLIRVAKPVIGNEEIREVVESLKSGWLTAGPKVARFEEEMEQYLGAKNIILVSSCTAAFHLILKALEIGPGDEVITPSLTYTSIGNIILNVGAIPVFVDVDPQTMTLDPSEFEKKITKRTKAVVPVDYAGLPANYTAINKIAKEHNITVIDDAATAFGASYKNKKIGTVADFTCFSFYATKNITTIEGGAVATANEAMAEKIRLLSKLGVTANAWNRHSSRSSWYFEVVEPGLKYYMNDVQAAFGLHQLKKVDSFLKRRKQIAKHYYTELKETPILQSPYQTFPEEHSWNFYPTVINRKMGRDAFMTKMEELGVASSVYYIPLHTHKIFQKYIGEKDTFPVTTDFFSREVTLPLYPGLTDAQVEKVVRVVKKLSKELL